MASAPWRSRAFSNCLVITALLGLTAAHAASAAEPERKSYNSPDLKLTATVKTTKTGESEIFIGPSHGFLVYSKSFVSTDGEHGAIVTNAAWTPDSRFLVVGLQHTGGHGPWNFPIFFWDRNDRQLRSLDARVGGITGSAEITAPDIVSSTFMGAQGDPEPFSISLSSAVRNWPDVAEKDCKTLGGKVVSGHNPTICSNNETFVGRIPGMKCSCVCCDSSWPQAADSAKKASKH
ncbi:MAG TPA: hypothetical protein VN915_11095 [Elusimicrobiota bacterium]|nr:hypothetical protein [Elusimicrobiota bacterium]